MKTHLIIGLLMLAVFACAESPKQILLVAGSPSHGAGEHEFPAGCDLLAKALNAAGLNLEAAVHYGNWPTSGQLDGIDALVVYCDGDDRHVALGHEAELLALSQRGAGIVFLHYAVDGTPGVLNETLMKVIGGYYDDEQSENPIWTVNDPVITAHPVTRGVKPFELKDEWYYNLRFGDVVPLLKAVPPEEGKAHTLAWTFGTNALGFTGGHFDSFWGQPDVRRLVLNAMVWSAGLEVPDEGVDSETPVVLKYKSMLHAIAKGDPGDLRNHIRLGADVNEKDKRGWTPLLHAAVRGKAECAAVLLDAGAQLEPRDSTEKTPLHFAAGRGFLEIVKLLIENGADFMLRDNEGWSPLHYAAEKDRVDVAAYLIGQGAEVDARSRRGGTPLHEASASASPEMIKLLLKNGADKNIKADNGKTPLDYAIELGNDPAVELLK